MTEDLKKYHSQTFTRTEMHFKFKTDVTWDQ